MAVGLVRWIEDAISRLFPKDDNDWRWPKRLVKWAAVLAQLFFFYKGIVFFLTDENHNY
jgi:hypothetical protein